MKSISQITRRNIFDFVQIEGFWWSGRIEEAYFLARIFNLEKMKLYDDRFPNAVGEIWQFRVLEILTTCNV